VDGVPEAINEALRLYAPLIHRQSVIDGVFDEDCRQHIMLHVTKQITKFRGNPKKNV
jgi:hypothetical protein